MYTYIYDTAAGFHATQLHYGIRSHTRPRPGDIALLGACIRSTRRFATHRFATRRFATRPFAHMVSEVAEGLEFAVRTEELAVFTEELEHALLLHAAQVGGVGTGGDAGISVSLVYHLLLPPSLTPSSSQNDGHRQTSHGCHSTWNGCHMLLPERPYSRAIAGALLCSHTHQQLPLVPPLSGLAQLDESLLQLSWYGSFCVCVCVCACVVLFLLVPSVPFLCMHVLAVWNGKAR